MLDLTLYPRVEWRTARGEVVLRLRGGPRAVTPALALEVTALWRAAVPRKAKRVP